MLALATLGGGESALVALREAAGARRRPHGGADVVRLAPPRRRWSTCPGGETTVTIAGGGRGGRNAEYLLGLALALDGRAGISALAGDTDGVDGTEDNAGAVVTPDTLARARAAGLDLRSPLWPRTTPTACSRPSATSSSPAPP